MRVEEATAPPERVPAHQARSRREAGQVTAQQHTGRREGGAWTLVARQRLAGIARDLWLPTTATRAQVEAALAELSPGPRRDELARRLASIPEGT